MSERRAPVQPESCGGLPRAYPCKKHPPDDPRHKSGSVAWSEHVEAWRDYAKRHDQTAERIAERGGFSYGELAYHLGREPRTWESS